MTNKAFHKKILSQKFFGFLDSAGSEPIVATNIEDIVNNHLGYDSCQEALQDVREYWCWSSKSNTFNADIDGPTFTAGNSEEEVLQRLAMCLKGI